MTTTRLQAIWTEHCQGIRVSPQIADKWWTTLVQKYTEVQRHYHTLDHIADMFVLYDSWNQRLMNCNAVALAIFFHDIVYDPKSPCNEQDSIQMFRAFALEAELNAHLIDATIQLIDATITHLSNVADDNRDLKFFLDFDMAVLGRPADGYRDYAGQIQREYCHLDTETFNTKRAQSWCRTSQFEAILGIAFMLQVLQNFLTREHIFSTEEFKQLYEEQARTNIAREITLLQSQST